MIDIQSAMTENSRGKKKKEEITAEEHNASHIGRA